MSVDSGLRWGLARATAKLAATNSKVEHHMLTEIDKRKNKKKGHNKINRIETPDDFK